MDQILLVWHGIGNVIREKILSGRGVKLDKFGVFSLTLTGDPVFNMTPDFAAEYKLRQHTLPASDNITVTKLNFHQLSTTIGIARSITEKVYEKFMGLVGTAIQANRSILLTMHRVAEIQIRNGELRCTYMSDFLNKLNEVRKRQGLTTTNQIKPSDTSNKTIKTLSKPSDYKGKSKEDLDAERMITKGAHRPPPQQKPRARDPITGDREKGGNRPRIERDRDENPYINKGNQPRYNPITGNIKNSQRPQSARSESSNGVNGSDRSVSSVSPRPNGQRARPSSAFGVRGGDRSGDKQPEKTRPDRGQLDRQRNGHIGKNSYAVGTPDARNVAAAALGTDDIVEKIRQKIVARGGVHGIRSLARLLSIMDDNGDKRLSKDELKYGLRDYGLDISGIQLEQLMIYFDRDKNGFIDFNEFLVGLRGPLSERRIKLIRMAFNVLDTDKSGVVTLQELLSKYNVSKHPDVISGKLTPTQAVKDFSAQWDKSHDGEITFDEFLEYYKDVSASIDDDVYFELMIRNAWHISGGEGQAANTANRRVLVTRKDGTQAVVEVQDDLGAGNDRDELRRRLGRQGDDGSVDLYGGMDTRDKAKRGVPKGRSDRSSGIGLGGNRASQPRKTTTTSRQPVYDDYGGDEALPDDEAVEENTGGYGKNQPVRMSGLSLNDKDARDPRQEPSPGLMHLITQLKDQIKSHGGSGFLGLQRKFRIIADDDGNNTISLSEFKKAMNELKLKLTEKDLQSLFEYFDTDHSGSIDFEEFLKGLRDPMNARRLKLVLLAWNKIDKNQDGKLDIDEVASMYDVSKHPDVLSGQMSREQAYQQFMKHFDSPPYDGVISRDDFIDYYTNIGASIENENYFELMIRNAWHISGGEGQAANTANRRVLVTRKDGTQAVVEVQDDLGAGNGRDELRRRLGRQGDDGSVDLYGGMDTRDKAKRGVPKGRAQSVGNGGRRQSSVSSDYGGDEALPMDDPGEETGSPYLAKLRELLYNPPASLDDLAVKLQVAIVGNPRIVKDGFQKRMMSMDRQLTTRDIDGIWTTFDPKNRGIIDLSALHEFLANNFGKDKGSRSGSIIDRVIARIRDRASTKGGIAGLQRTLAIMDKSKNKRLEKEEFLVGMKIYGVDLNQRELENVFKFFDKDSSGAIDFDEFILAIRGEMNDKRKYIVKMTFDRLDTDKSGVVTMEELIQKYDVSKHPDVISGKITKQQALNDFISQWDTNRDGTITLEEFMNYYNGVSSSIDGDVYFELMIRNAWHISGGEGQAANTANRRVLVTRKDGTQAVVEVQDDLGAGNDRDELRRRLGRQGDDGSVDLYGGMDTRDKAKRKDRPRKSAW